MAMVLREKLLPLLKDQAHMWRLDWRLVDAIVQVESAYAVLAIRYEPDFKSLAIPARYAKINNVTEATEANLQKFSFGLIQIMGATARWLGYQGPMPALFEPENNLNWGCRYLNKLYVQHALTENVVAAYNAGSVRRNAEGRFVNQEHVDKVMKAYAQSL